MIYVIFRVAKNYNCKLSALISYNYLAATFLGLLLFFPSVESNTTNTLSWLPYAVILGILFIVMFYFIGHSSQKAGITVTTLANKLSLVFPVLFSLIFFNEQISTIKYIGLATAVLAVVLTVYKKDVRRTNLIFILLPLIIFVGSGVVDSLVKYVQATQITDSQVSLYTIIVFFIAFLCGLVLSFIKKEAPLSFHRPTLLLGVLLGAANFGSLFFILKALNNSNLNSSLVFALNNMLVVALTAIIGMALFKEKLNKINLMGILLALISLYFLL
jgi:drug/metabolite transporter (DMT)-like permease